MKIALIGASGLVGAAVLEETIFRRHEVTAMVREPNKIKLQSDKLTVIKADATNVLESVFHLQHHEVIASAYNAGWRNPNLYNDFRQGSHSIQQAVK